MHKRELQVDMDAILEAIDSHGDPNFYFDTESGRVEAWLDPAITGDDPDFDPDEPNWVEIPRRPSREAHRAMERFAATVDEPDVLAQLRLALGGRGSFHRFRAVLALHPDLRAAYEAADHAELLRDALSWLHELGIEPRYTLRQPQQPPPRPPAPPRVTLTDLLLLGAPEGKTELLDGRVARMFRAKNPAQARRVFTDIARQLTEQEGVSWRNRFVEGRDRYSIGRSQLAVEADLVTLEVQMPRSIWDAFG